MSDQRGDTIIEVILACTMLALVTTSSFAIMQRGTATTYDSMERSQVRLQLNGQSELLNYFRDEYIKAISTTGVIAPGSPADMWRKISLDGTVTASAATPVVESCTPPSGNAAFSIRLDTSIPAYRVYPGSITAPSGMPSPGDGIWIQRIDPGGGPARNFHDFYIMACWDATTSQKQYMSSIVRLYEP
jgi:hypothetical protein